MQHKEHNFHGLSHSAKLLDELVRQKLAPLDMLPRQAHVLVAMQHIAPVSQARLAEIFDITPASMSTMTDRLLAAGYITRKPDPNSRRKNMLELTEAGRAKLQAVSGAWDAVDEIIAAALGPEDAAELYRLSRRLRDALGGAPPGARAANSERP